MRVTWILLVCSFSFIRGTTQSLEKDYRFETYAVSDLVAGSPQANMVFARKLIYGGYIGEDDKSAIMQGLNGSNLIGARWETEAGVRIYGSARGRYEKRPYTQFYIQDFYQSEAVFSSELVDLVLNGNRKYENATADLSGMTFDDLRLQSIGAGKYWHGSRWGCFLGIGLVSGQRFNQTELQRATLFTAPLGDYIDLNIRGKSLHSAVANDKIFSFGGTGAGLDISLDADLNSALNVKVSARRLGFVSFSKGNVSAVADTSYRYEGAVIKNILDSFILDFKSPEEIKNDILKTGVTGASNRIIPSIYSARISFSPAEGRLAWAAMLEVMPATEFRPSLQGNLDYRLTRQIKICLNAGAGGYSIWNAGLGAQLILMKRLMIRADARSAFNLLTTGHPASLVAGASIRVRL